MLTAEQAGILALVEAGTGRPAQAIADAVTGRGGQEGDRQQQREAEPASSSEDPGGEQQAVAGQEQADQQPGLGEHDRPHPDQAEGVQEVLGVQPAAELHAAHFLAGRWRLLDAYPLIALGKPGPATLAGAVAGSRVDMSLTTTPGRVAGTGRLHPPCLPVQRRSRRTSDHGPSTGCEAVTAAWAA
jgi:hypothetical protein